MIRHNEVFFFLYSNSTFLLIFRYALHLQSLLFREKKNSIWFLCFGVIDVNSYLPLGALLIGWVHEDSSVGDSAMNVWHHWAHVAGSVGRTAILWAEVKYVTFMEFDCEFNNGRRPVFICSNVLIKCSCSTKPPVNQWSMMHFLVSADQLIRLMSWLQLQQFCLCTEIMTCSGTERKMWTVNNKQVKVHPVENIRMWRGLRTLCFLSMNKNNNGF